MTARKLAIGAGVAVLALAIAGGLWVRSVFARDTVRSALAAQISTALGQPVAIGGIGASILPRVTVTLKDVAIGDPPRIRAETLRLGTALGALLTRRIVHGSVHLDGATIQLPLPPFRSGSPSQPSSGLPVEIVSIDEIVLNDVELVSGGRTLRANIEVMPHGSGATLRKVSLSADDTSVEGSGEISDLAGPSGALTLNARTLNLTKLLDFFTAFSSGSTLTSSSAPRASGAAPPNLVLSLTADRATMGMLALDRLGARVRVTGQGVALDPLEFALFDGSCKGTMTLASRAGASTLRLDAAVSNLDVASAMAFAGSPGTISGRLSGRIDVSTPTTDPSKAIGAARGTARVDVRDGVVKNLGLVRTIVIATSMRADAPSPLPGGSTDEPFTVLGASFDIAGGRAQTDDLRFESKDVLLRAAGSIRLDGSALDLEGDVQLSEALSQQAGRDLFRYTQEQGRVTLPATITGSVQAPSVHVDAAAAAQRAIQNKAKEELKKALGRIIKKK
jgi:uncharacterized protein involved in outer membrane biogenesis